ncbi:hypothetical protein OR16_05964 [Cupriavidus basilensis OR16]|uniref:DUF1484 domain-containing protein n=1 Tax=Cupriavidus basilensis OR16 TaxID=1127483 RepID=H1S0Q1_9BURK|nr:DUF1484 family protein [Cupriavidus basilensis]EHP43910.1 hypothetical protein OR16_05964 [Cupriavidus basilensis OR16]
MRPSARAGPSPPDSLLAISKQGDLIAELIGMTRPANAEEQPRVRELIDQIGAQDRGLRERMADHCAELQSVSAALDSLLHLAELHSEKTEEAYGLYCLLKLLKLQLDEAVGELAGMA